jgi:hypothetical protein
MRNTASAKSGAGIAVNRTKKIILKNYQKDYFLLTYRTVSFTVCHPSRTALRITSQFKKSTHETEKILKGLKIRTIRRTDNTIAE